MFLCTTGYFALVEALQEISGYTVLKLLLASFNVISKFINYKKILAFFDTTSFYKELSHSPCRQKIMTQKQKCVFVLYQQTTEQLLSLARASLQIIHSTPP